jgi:hypothetical protein
MEEDFQLITFSGTILPTNSSNTLNKIIKKVSGEKDIVLRVGISAGGVRSRFKSVIKKIKKKCTNERGSECFITAVFVNYCGSSCTFLALWADYSIALPYSKFGFHRLWLISPNIPIESKKKNAEYYIKQGGNSSWFLENQEKISINQTIGYHFTKQEEIDSGLIDLQLNSYDEFLKLYRSSEYYLHKM